MPLTVPCSTTVAASAEEVFRAWTNADALRAWFAEHVDLEASANADVPTQPSEGGPTSILDMQPDEHLVLDWPDWRGDPAVPDQRIAFTLSDQTSGGTRVEFVHDGFTRAVDVSDFPFGWREFLCGLARVAESLDTPPGQ